VTLGPYHLFEVVGIEIEYMLVDCETLAVRPEADRLIERETGEVRPEVPRGAIDWSNELALHLIELKTHEPAPGLDGLAADFQAEVAHICGLLAPQGATLCPGGMHPFMDPDRETRLWPHEHGAVYRAFDRIFDCRGHGWANLQSVHLNLPFADALEFGRLHAAVRVALPLLPALAASSPFTDARPTGWMDTRLACYRDNARRVPSVTGSVVPEPVFTPDDYRREILERIYADLAPLDPEGLLHHEWINARGCIARFDRGAIEIRVLDVSECPAADLAIADAVVALVRALCEGWPAAPAAQRAFPTDSLAKILEDVAREGDRARVSDRAYLELFRVPAARPCTAGELWSRLLEDRRIGPRLAAASAAPLAGILRDGCLARRLLRAAGPDPTLERIRAVYRELAACLAAGRTFAAPSS
jgi:gamma-glutamyl:cysteine ligase YbdK (ATP-grasp superfamily)